MRKSQKFVFNVKSFGMVLRNMKKCFWDVQEVMPLSMAHGYEWSHQRKSGMIGRGGLGEVILDLKKHGMRRGKMVSGHRTSISIAIKGGR
jgi:hypothetical protein